jgi:hypothetical protein
LPFSPLPYNSEKDGILENFLNFAVTFILTGHKHSKFKTACKQIQKKI